MRRRFYTTLSFDPRGSGPRRKFAAAILCAVTIASSLPAGAQDPVMRAIEVRSFLGEHLNLRIALAASTEAASSVICQSVIDNGKRDNALGSSDLILTMVELRETRYLQVRSRAPYREPVARFSIRIGCPGEPLVDREFIVLLDPPPFTASVVLPAVGEPAAAGSIAGSAISTPTAKPARNVKPVVPVAGTWAAREGDTLAKLATGIHPKDRARRQQYLTVLRELNPLLDDLEDDAPLAVGSKLFMPDLQVLSGIAPHEEVMPAPPPKSVPAATKTATKIRATPPATAPVMKLPKAPPTPTVVPSVVPHVVPAPAKSASPKLPAPVAAASIKEAPAVPPPAANPPAKAQPRSDGFQLRLSHSEIDLSRSRNVTDEQRRQLREKQLMLDADDQVAALLSLKNTVKQLEQRLNELQLKLATAPSLSAMPPGKVVVPPPPAPATSSVSAAVPTKAETSAPPPAPVSVPAIQSPAPVSLPDPPASTATPTPPAAVPPTQPAAVPHTQPAVVEKPAPPTPAPTIAAAPAPSLAEQMMGSLPPPMVSGGVLGAQLLLIAAWFWSRGVRKSTAVIAPPKVTEPDIAMAREMTRDVPAVPNNPATSGNADFSAPAHPPAEVSAPPSASGEFLETTRNLVIDAPSSIADVQYDHIDAPVVFDDTPARFELDSNTATTVDFLVGMDEQLPEDRVRRLQYMHERYPELKSNTVSIDDADSVINAARLYYDEAGTDGGREKASELLTFAVEERPQEVRFWLAQFEIFRLENMAAEFTALAGKFHVLFSHTPAWPKVRHIGYEMAPGNPLFAASVSPLLAAEARFDPIAENWLNAPMDFASDALTSDMRLALLGDHGVNTADFEWITAHLTEPVAQA